MGEGPELSLREALASVPDPRHPPGRRQPLAAILALAVGAMRGDDRRWYAIAQGGREHPELTQALGFTRAQTPRVATRHHVFRRLAGAAFAAALTPGARAAPPEQRSVLAGDGKALRGSHGDELPGGHLVAAYAVEARPAGGAKGRAAYRLCPPPPGTRPGCRGRHHPRPVLRCSSQRLHRPGPANGGVIFNLHG